MSSAAADPPLFDVLLSRADVLDTILFEWIDTRDLVQLDMAAVHAESRAKLHAAMANVRFSVPFIKEANFSRYWQNHWEIINWVVKRKLYSSVDTTWLVSQKLWEGLLADPKYHALVASFRVLQMQYFLSNWDFSGLRLCTNLQQLTIYNFNFPDQLNPSESSPSTTGAVFGLPMLRKLRLVSCAINDNLLDIFEGRAPQLEILDLQHARYRDGGVSVAGRTHAFFSRFTRIEVLGNVAPFLTAITHGPAVPRLSALILDRMHAMEEGAADLSALIRCCPSLRDLTVARMRVHVPSLVGWLDKYVPNLERLHLDNVRVTDVAPAAANGCVVANTKINVKELQISSLIPSTIAETMNILSHAPVTTHLTLSMMNRLDGEAMRIIAARHRFSSVEIHERKGYFSSTPILEEIKAAFADTPALKIVEWLAWTTEPQKALRMDESKVLFVR